jgi:uncharacterized cupin superfamily protein
MHGAADYGLRVRRVNLLGMDPSDWSHGQLREGFRWRAAGVGRQLGAARIGGTLYDLNEGERTFPYHFHHGMEEWLIVIEGTPTLRTQGYERELRAGDVVCFPVGPEGGHQVLGPGVVLIFSASRPLEVIEYVESGKVGVRPPGKIFRAADEVEYWEGEELPEQAAAE